jgi:hypothetical protein
MVGRVMSIQLLSFATIPLGAMPLAWLADLFGGRLAVAVAGLAVTAAVAGVALLYPPSRALR